MFKLFTAIALLGVAQAQPVPPTLTLASPDVHAAARKPRIKAVLAAVERLDRALVEGDRTVFAESMANELAVNNPGNLVARRGGVVRMNVEGRIAYLRYERTIEYAGLRGGMVVLMGEELVVPRPPNPLAGQVVRRRFTDLWREVGGRWQVSARQATIVPPR